MSSKTVKNIREPLKKPRPLRSSSIEQAKDALSPKARADLLAELEMLNVRLSNCDFDEVLTADISLMCSLLKKNGEELDTVHKDALDRFFSTLRNICREDRLDVISRLKLLEIIEMRAMRWRTNENITNYFSSKFSQLEEANEKQILPESVSSSSILSAQNQNFPNNSSASLAPGEILRSSGKFSRPTKIAGKNYFKDEIVIRNCDSGKVNAGARDRLVQITGPHEEAISHAKYLVEDTIKRNVSPVRDNLNTADFNVDNKEHVDYSTSYFDRGSQARDSKRNLLHSYSMSDASSREFSVPVFVGQDIIMLSGTKAELLKTAKAVLTQYFSDHTDHSGREPNALSHSKSFGNENQGFLLKKQASLKDDLPSTFPSVDQSLSRQSSSMSSSSDDSLPDEESNDAIDPPVPAPIPPPTPCHQLYTRKFLLECASLPLSRKPPSDYECIKSNFPELIPQAPVLLDPSQYLQRSNVL